MQRGGVLVLKWRSANGIVHRPNAKSEHTRWIILKWMTATLKLVFGIKFIIPPFCIRCCTRECSWTLIWNVILLVHWPRGINFSFSIEIVVPFVVVIRVRILEFRFLKLVSFFGCRGRAFFCAWLEVRCVPNLMQHEGTNQLNRPRALAWLRNLNPTHLR